MTREIHLAESEEQVRRCWPVFEELRENIATQEEFLRRWKIQREEGFRIAYLEVDGEVQAVAGYRVLNSMAWGRILYLDDLAALRSQHGDGLGTALLVFVQQEARRLGCEAVHLDTGYHRQRAHKAYLRNGFELSCHHLAWKVPDE